MKLNLRTKYKRRLPARILTPLIQPCSPNENWSMDFMHDGLINGRPFRSFSVIEDFNREVLGITWIQVSLSAANAGTEPADPVARKTSSVASGQWSWIHCLCHGAMVCQEWYQAGVYSKRETSSKRIIERFNRTYREEVLDNYCLRISNKPERWRRHGCGFTTRKGHTVRWAIWHRENSWWNVENAAAHKSPKMQFPHSNRIVIRKGENIFLNVTN